MPHLDDRSKNKLRDQVNTSGFPLQLAIRNRVKSDDPIPFRLHSEEHAWSNEVTGTNGFIDLVLKHTVFPWYFAVACKRVTNRVWIFLVPHEEHRAHQKAAAWFTYIRQAEFEPFNWETTTVFPESFESSYCAIKELSATSNVRVSESTDPDSQADTQHTVFVVNSAHLVDFLKDFEPI